MTQSSEEFESFRWTLIGMYLCIVELCMCTFLAHFLMNGDEIVRNVPYTLAPSEIPILGLVTRVL
jgi:hypothetical protein